MPHRLQRKALLLLDEVRISSVARSPEWIAAAHANQLAPGSFVQVGEQEQAP